MTSDIETDKNFGMNVGVDERRLVVEAIATLAHRKSDLVTFILKPAGVPKGIYEPLLKQRDDLSGRLMTKRQTAPLILDALEGRGDYADVVERLIQVAADWGKFELSDNEYEARAVKAKALEISKRHQQLDAKEAARNVAATRESHREHLLARTREIRLLLAMLDELATQDQNPQERGFRLQDLLNRLFDAFDIPVHRSFTRNEGAEQIDGAFEIDGWYYLTECRWRRKLTDTREVDGLAGQISRSGKQTMGLFLSINGWSDNVPPLLKQNAEKAIILMHGYDLRSILAEEVDLRDYIKAAVKNLNLHSEPYFGVKEYMEQAT